MEKGSSRLVVSYLKNREQVDSSRPYFTKTGKRLCELNRSIIHLNLQFGNQESDIPYLEGVGRRSSVKEGVRRYSSQPNWCREQVLEQRLHVSNRYRSTLLNKLLRSIREITPSRSLVNLPSITKKDLTLQAENNGSRKGLEEKEKKREPEHESEKR